MERGSITQLSLARASGVSQAAISRYVKGLSTPSANDLCRLANQLGVSMDSLWKSGEYPPADNAGEKPVAAAHKNGATDGRSAEEELAELKRSLQIIFHAMTEPLPKSADKK